MASPTRSDTNTSRVCVIHGHDGAAGEMVAEFWERLGLEPVISREQPNQRRTITEKLEECADVSFTAVLLTPDGNGGSIENNEVRTRRTVECRI